MTANEYGHPPTIRAEVYTTVRLLPRARPRHVRPVQIYPTLVKWMGENGVDEKQLGEMVDRHTRTIKNYLEGHSPLPMPVILRLVEITGMTFEELFLGAE